MRQRQVSSWWAQWTCVGGTCAPPAEPAGDGFERALDLYTGLTAPFLRGCYLFVVLAVVAVASFRLGAPAGLWLAAAFLLVYSAYCLANFLRCREAHCIVTGAGWSALALAATWGALSGHDIRAAVWDGFLAIAIVGHSFEGVWKAVRGTNALRRA